MNGRKEQIILLLLFLVLSRVSAEEGKEIAKDVGAYVDRRVTKGN